MAEADYGSRPGRLKQRAQPCQARAYSCLVKPLDYDGLSRPIADLGTYRLPWNERL